MQNSEITFYRAPGLPVVLAEIVERLLRDEWSRECTTDGKHVYYVVGTDLQTGDLESKYEFRHELPFRPHLGPVSDAVVRSQVADNRTDYLGRARQNLKRAGISDELLDGILGGDFASFTDWWASSPLGNAEKAALMNPLLEAMRLTSTGVTNLELSTDDQAAVDEQREKRCLQELAGKYPKIVKRWQQLEQISFDDVRLEEASKAFLYGFYRASVVLCASTVESQLKRICGSDRMGAFDLIELAHQSGRLPREIADHTRELFRVRNGVVHDDRETSSDRAKEMLAVARMLVAELRQCERIA